MHIDLTPAVVWLSLGVLLMIVEVSTGGFWVGFFGVGALITSLIVWLGVVGNLDLEVALFLSASVLPLLFLRKPFTQWLNRGAPSTTFGDTGQIATVVKEIPSHGVGRVDYQGSTWDAESDQGEAVPSHARVRIVRQDGTRLYVRIEHTI